ncbi:MAG: extracellular solute-binding protein [Streptosporangiales bacterium]|nr:extracellular solute-binding protein [Streptosporangiales bacterium]
MRHLRTHLGVRGPRAARRRRTMGVAAVASVLALSAAACGGIGPAASGSIDQDDAGALGGPEAVKQFKQLYDQARESGENTVVFYGPLAENFRPVFAAFSKRFPGIRARGLTTFGAGLQTRVNQEAASGQHVADVAATGNTSMLELASQDRFVSYKPFMAKDITDPYLVNSDNTIIGFTSDVRGVIYNTSSVPPAQAPKGWDDLLDPKWKGGLAITDATTAGGGLELFSRMFYDRGSAANRGAGPRSRVKMQVGGLAAGGNRCSA